MRNRLPVTLLLACAFAAPGALAQDLEALEKAIEKARNEAPLTLKPFVVVKRPAKYFGDYEARPDNNFRRGEKLHFYGEPKNLVQVRNAAGQYEPAFEVDLEVRAPSGETIKQPKFASFRLPARSRISDIFLNLDVSLTSAPAGQYTVRFVVRDLNSKKVGTVDQPVTLK